MRLRGTPEDLETARGMSRFGASLQRRGSVDVHGSACKLSDELLATRLCKARRSASIGSISAREPELTAEMICRRLLQTVRFALNQTRNYRLQSLQTGISIWAHMAGVPVVRPLSPSTPAQLLSRSRQVRTSPRSLSW